MRFAHRFLVKMNNSLERKTRDLQAFDGNQAEVDDRMLREFRARILVDARWDGGGIGVYTRSLLQGLTSLTGASVTVLARKNFVAPFADRFTDIIRDQTPHYSLRERYALLRKIDQSRFDLLHVPHYTLPMGATVPAVVTVHDLIHLTHPPRWYHPFVARRLIRSAITRAQAVIAVSHATASELRRAFPVAGPKLEVVPNALRVVNSDGGDTDDPGEIVNEVGPPVSSEASPGAPLLLSVISQDKPHKGIDDLLDAFAHARRVSATVRCYHLVLAGYGVTSSRIREAIARRGLEAAVRILGAVSERDLGRLYRRARMMIVPSRAEGFGLPVLEAQCSGLPIVMRPVPALLELATPIDVVSEDLTVGALASAIRTACERGLVALDPEVLARHLAQYSLAHVIEGVTRVYMRVLSGSAR